jgi:hypothetical protein
MGGAELFVGLITHKGSKFNRDGEAHDTIRKIEAAMAQRGIACSSLISDRDDYSPTEHPLTRTRLLASALFQAKLEFQWRRYLAHGRPSSFLSLPRDVAILMVMSARRVRAYLGLNPFLPAVQMPGAPQVIRLLNIDLSHLRVYRAALQSKATGVLVIEDDAQQTGGDEAMDVLAYLLSRLEMVRPELVNLSESISMTALGVSGIVAEKTVFEGIDGMGLCSCTRPVTNTVCANLFNRRFIELLVSDIDKRDLWPVIPIDWRLNRMILDEWNAGTLDASSCSWVSPGIFIQGSMHRR